MDHLVALIAEYHDPSLAKCPKTALHEIQSTDRKSRHLLGRITHSRKRSARSVVPRDVAVDHGTQVGRRNLGLKVHAHGVYHRGNRRRRRRRGRRAWQLIRRARRRTGRRTGRSRARSDVLRHGERVLSRCEPVVRAGGKRCRICKTLRDDGRHARCRCSSRCCGSRLRVVGSGSQRRLRLGSGRVLSVARLSGW